jgi:hypothetical protein
MTTTEQDGWLHHLSYAFARDGLTAEEHESDVQDVLYGMLPRNFLRTVEGKQPVYTDTTVPYAWI